KVIIPADKLFVPDGTVVNPGGRARRAHVAGAMKSVKGTVLVSVYTDNRAVDGRFASTYESSLARARAITQLLATQLAPGPSVKAEGRGDSNPLLPNDS
ncbi:hypothetical protein SB719_19495, partial [Pantoea sp. SIMBA_079]